MDMSNNMREVSLEEMDQVSGGVYRTVNTGMAGIDAGLFKDASRKSGQIDHIPNGTVVDTTSDELIWDPDTQRHYVEVTYKGKVGYVASSLLGMKR